MNFYKPYITIISVLLHLASSSFAQPVLIKIDPVVGVVNPESLCQVESWGSDRASCICYLVKKISDMRHGTLAPRDLVNQAMSVSGVSRQDMESILGLSFERMNSTPESFWQDSLRQAIEKVYSQFMVIKPVAADGISLDDAGYFTSDSLKQFLQRAYDEGKLELKGVSGVTCLKVRSTSSEAKGANTKQLFLISFACDQASEQDYILKDMSSGNAEATALALGSGIAQLQTMIFPRFMSGFPNFIFPAMYLSYEYKGIRHYLALLPKAPGIQLSSFSKEYKHDSSELNLKRAIEAYYYVGQAIANLHKKYGQVASTFTHGDFHYNNIFFDEVTKRVYLIDNERVYQNFMRDKHDINNDVTYLFSVSQSSKVTDPAFFRDFPAKEVFDQVTIESFITGYLSAYDPSAQGQIYTALKNRFYSMNDRGEYGSYRLYWQGMNAAFAVLDKKYLSDRNLAFHSSRRKRYRFARNH